MPGMAQAAVAAIGSAAFLLVLAGLEIGYRLGARAHRKFPDEKESPVSAAAAAVLGLVAFMLSFTFGSAAGRFDTLKQLLRDEANAIGTAWLRAEFLPGPAGEESRALLLRYLDLRIGLANSGPPEAAEMEKVLRESERIHSRLWEACAGHARAGAQTPLTALYAQSLNALFDIHANRVAVALDTRMPAGIWAGLFCLTLLGMMSIGYQTGVSGSPRTLARIFLALAFAVAITLIAAIDDPLSGLIRAPQAPLVKLRQSLSGHESGGAAASSREPGTRRNGPDAGNAGSPADGTVMDNPSSPGL